jgi:RimJ/RimL family protein N-acetyltransferase
VIETPRLRLRTLSADFLRASLAGDRHGAESLLGAMLPEDWPDERDLLSLRQRQVEEDPARAPWLTRAMELRSARRVIGVVGFHGPPGGAWLDELAPGGVELGYTVYPAWRRRGLAREASEALMDWAVRAAGVRTFALSMSPDNRASVGLARVLGFEKAGSWSHPARGIEHVYRRDVCSPENASSGTGHRMVEVSSSSSGSTAADSDSG